VEIPQDLLDLYTNAPLLELGGLADAARRERHPHGVVSYIVDRNINYTNVCVADCGFCAFYRRPKHSEGYTLSFEEIGAKIDETKAMGGVQILIQGGHNPYIPFEWYLDLLRYIKRYHPIHIHGFSPSEVDFFSEVFQLDARTVIRELQSAGLDSIPGGGGEILVQRVRDIAVPNLQASWVTMGLKVGQTSLHFGCNDFGSLMIEENVVSAANTTYRTTTDEIERLIREAGFTPHRRRQDYTLLGSAAA
jgi:2-iminoacetate synthase ThiH